jgi:hypothetical protein
MLSKTLKISAAVSWLMICGSITAWAGAPSNSSVLYIGDSISFMHTPEAKGFGPTLLSSLLGASNQVSFIASCGFTPQGYLQSGVARTSTICGYFERDADAHITVCGENDSCYPPSLIDKITLGKTGKPVTQKGLLSTLHPRVTIVQLGTNVAANSSPISPTQIGAVMRMMAAIKASGSQCVWITPPNGNERYKTKDPKTGQTTWVVTVTPEKIREVRDMIDEIARQQDCIAVDALSTTIPPSASDVHPGPDEGAKWANLVEQSLNPLLTRLLETPPAAKSLAPGGDAENPASPANAPAQ